MEEALLDPAIVLRATVVMCCVLELVKVAKEMGSRKTVEEAVDVVVEDVAVVRSSEQHEVSFFNQ